MATKIEIINAALQINGQERISLLTENTENARRMLSIYDVSLKELLRLHPWSFAKKEASLSLIDEDPLLTDDYLYIFSLPPDFLRLLKTDVESSGYSHKIKGMRLYSNSNAVKIEYIYYMASEQQLDSTFTAAFIAKLAYETAYAMTGDTNLPKLRESEYTKKLNTAKSANGQEVTPDEPTNDTWLNSRI